jgi:beta-lactamase class D
LNDAFIGGKTGTLNGRNPVGRYDWFVGFAERDGVKLAVASLCIHGPRHGVKASQVARAAFESYFRQVVAGDSAPKQKSNHS